MVGVGVLVDDDGCTTLNPRMPNRRVNDIGRRAPMRSDVVTGDIGYTPRKGFRWRGKQTITSNRLDQMRGEKIIQTRSKVAANNQKSKVAANMQSQCSTSRKPSVPWK
ncbi:uncharacterized protein LOC132069489 [Lycium ferocissimum]|uniref:uncharacterized protein LOC132069489 n=1 Tax=Lycium ferocissimum TaxID=112874 RepID=UPI0028167D3B|nr:uncharacterized protein LOC132069489 [Lycium ferocissimum]